MNQQQTKNNVSNTLYTVSRQLADASVMLKEAGLYGIAEKIDAAHLAVDEADNWLSHDINTTEGDYQQALETDADPCTEVK